MELFNCITRIKLARFHSSRNLATWGGVLPTAHSSRRGSGTRSVRRSYDHRFISVTTRWRLTCVLLLLPAMLASALLLVLVPAGFAQAAPPPKFNFKNLVTFGDSYTDVVWTGEKDYAWPTYATGYAKATLFPYARAGGTCSNNVAYRPFPSVSESQVSSPSLFRCITDS